MFVMTGLRAVIDHITKNTGLACSVGLFIDDPITITQDTVLGDLTEPVFSGYAQQLLSTIAFPAASDNLGGEAESDGPTITFECDVDGIPFDITGLFVTIDLPAGGTVLLTAHKFATPIHVEFDGDLVEKKINWFDKDY